MMDSRIVDLVPTLLPYLRVSVFDGAPNAQKPRCIYREYADEDVFLCLLDQVDLDPTEHAQVVGAIAALAVMPWMPGCCEDISLDEAQLIVLLKGVIHSRVA